MTLTVSEVFGPTVQGEGPTCGRRCAFIRLGRCNLDCGAGDGSTWACDTPYTWDWRGTIGPAQDPGALYQATPRELADQVRAMGVRRAVVTGGEPMLQLGQLVLLSGELVFRDVVMEVETNGTREPCDILALRVERFNVSPKLANSGVPLERRIVPAALEALQATGKAAFKFVCRSVMDLDEVGDLVERHRLRDVWIMPAGTNAIEVLTVQQALADAVVARGWNLSTRLHVLAWGDRRGK